MFDKSACLYYNLALVLLRDTEYVSKYNIIEMTSSRIVTERNAHEKRIREGQPLIHS